MFIFVHKAYQLGLIFIFFNINKYINGSASVLSEYTWADEESIGVLAMVLKDSSCAASWLHAELWRGCPIERWGKLIGRSVEGHMISVDKKDGKRESQNMQLRTRSRSRKDENESPERRALPGYPTLFPSHVCCFFYSLFFNYIFQYQNSDASWPWHDTFLYVRR